MKNNLKKKLILLGLLTELISLTGCHNKDNSYTLKITKNAKIVYEENNFKATGSVLYEEIEKNFRIITIEQANVKRKYLVIKSFSQFIGGRISNGYSALEYTDLKTGTVLVKYYCDSSSITEEELKQTEPIIGKNMKILEEQENLTDYLFIQDNIKREYDLNELITLFNEEMENESEEIKTLKQD